MFNRTPNVSWCEDINLSATGTATGTDVITDGTTARTKGAWVEFTTPLSDRASLLQVCLNNTNATQWFLVDIGIGTAAGSITPIAENLFFGVWHSFTNGVRYDIPCNLPKGTRVWARAASNGTVTNKRIRVSCLAHYGGDYSDSAPGGLVTMGADTTNIQGTTVDPGATANTQGAWVQLSAAVPDTLKGLQLGLGVHPTDTTTSYFKYFFYIGIGSAGSVTQIAGPIWSLSDNVADAQQPPVVYLPLQIPAGTGLFVSCQSDDATAGQRERSVIAYGHRA